LATTTTPLVTVILAAGQGKRMQDPTKPKVLYELAGTPLIGHVLAQAKSVESSRTIVIVGFGRDKVIEYVKSVSPQSEFAVQDQQLGTGHALQQTTSVLEGFDGNILILYGDVPLLTNETIANLLDAHRSAGARATILSAIFDDPTGYGRIVRTDDGKHLKAIVEHRDASTEILAIREINSGIYVFDAKTLFAFLHKLETNNNQAEYYLTDVFKMIVEAYGEDSVALSVTQNPIEVSGVNTKDQLAALEEYYLSVKETAA
jgi:bifunctional UDP-N-acetylglucosamine pyrophosphorylase / glucosamine-1-phosphate N-acetyltransferase